MNLFVFPHDQEIRELIAQHGSKGGFLGAALDHSCEMLIQAMTIVLEEEGLEEFKDAISKKPDYALRAVTGSLHKLIVCDTGHSPELSTFKSLLQMSLMELQSAWLVWQGKMFQFLADKKSGLFDENPDPELLHLVFSLTNPNAIGILSSLSILDLFQRYVDKDAVLEQYGKQDIHLSRTNTLSDIPGLSKICDVYELYILLTHLLTPEATAIISKAVARSVLGSDMDKIIEEALKEGGPAVITGRSKDPEEERSPSTVLH